MFARMLAVNYVEKQMKMNMWVFEQKRREEMDLVHRAMSMVNDYERANDREAIEMDDSCLKSRWSPPIMGHYKINVDAAIFKETGVGMGAVVCDSIGEVIAAMVSLRKGDYAVDIAEAMAARFALKIAWESGLRSVILETDNLKLFQHLKKAKVEASAFGIVVKDILQLATLCTSCSFSHVRRKGNQVAHKLAKLSKDCNEERIWIEELPEQLYHLVSDDLLE
ncbi:hypothetical protein RDABS01_037667 [Bienertia sinuspersici]